MGGDGVLTFRCMVRTCGPVAPMVLQTLPEAGGLDAKLHPLGESGSRLNFPWYVARYSWDIEKVGVSSGRGLA